MVEQFSSQRRYELGGGDVPDLLPARWIDGSDDSRDGRVLHRRRPDLDRLDRTDGYGPFRSAPGVLPAQPPPREHRGPSRAVTPSIRWRSTGPTYIANKFRRSVRLVGVGVGSGITQSSDWIVDPGAGYRTVVERGSYSHVRESPRYQARYQRRLGATETGRYYWVDKPTYERR